MHSVTYRRRDYLFAVRRKVVDDQLGWTICMRSPRTHEWLPVLGERPFTSSVADAERLPGGGAGAASERELRKELPEAATPETKEGGHTECLN